MISVVTNNGAMNAYAAIERSHSILDVALERLSTGQRVNAARDDAAGIAIASRIDSSIRQKVLSIKNAFDVQGLLDIADTSLGMIDNALAEIRQIAIKAANDTNAEVDRSALSIEVEQRLNGIRAIMSGSTYAGKEVFSDSALLAYIDGGRSIELPMLDLEELNLTARFETETNVRIVEDPITTYSVAPVDTPSPVGGEFGINSTTQYAQKNPAATKLSDGGAVVIWQSEITSGGVSEIKAQILSASGTKVGAELQITTPSGQKDFNPTIVGLSGGGFAVAWERSNLDGSNGKTYFQIFENNGSARTQASAVGVWGYSEPHIEQLENGNIIIANGGWIDRVVNDTSWGVGVTIYNTSGGLVKSEFKGHRTINNGQYSPHIIPLAGGGFAITFHSSAQYSGWQIRAHVFNSAAVSLGNEISVDHPSTFNPAGHKLAGGGFVLLWQKAGAIYAQKFNSSNVPSSNIFKVNDASINAADVQVVEVDSGDFIVSWTGNDSSGFGVYGQRFSSTFNKVGAEFQISSTTFQNQYASSLFRGSNDTFGAVWASDGQDGSGDGIFSRYFAFEETITDVQVTQRTVTEQVSRFVPGIDVLTRESSSTAIGIVDEAMEVVGRARGQVGATFNALSLSINYLTSAITNEKISHGLIVDADIAQESVLLAKSMILLEASTALLASAQASKDGVLELFRQFR